MYVKARDVSLMHLWCRNSFLVSQVPSIIIIIITKRENKVCLTFVFVLGTASENPPTVCWQTPSRTCINVSLYVNLEYEQRLMALKLPSLEHRTARGDMI